jgi:hypothetical protein
MSGSSIAWCDRYLADRVLWVGGDSFLALRVTPLPLVFRKILILGGIGGDIRPKILKANSLSPKIFHSKGLWIFVGPFEFFSLWILQLH